MNKPVIVLPIVVALLVMANAQAQSLDIRSAGCIGPCHSVSCCGKMIVVNKNGVGFGRDFDCKRFLDSAPAEVRRVLCALLREQGALCPEIEPLCGDEDDCDEQSLLKAKSGLGGLQLDFSGRGWTNDRKTKIKDTFVAVMGQMAKIAARLRYLREKADALPPDCEYKAELLRQLAEIDRIVRKMSSELFTYHEKIRVSVNDLGEDIAARVPPSILLKPRRKVIFNTNPKNDFFAKNLCQRAETLFHEVSHIAGTQDKGPCYQNAHCLTKSIFLNDDFNLRSVLVEIILEKGDSGCPEEYWPGE